MNDYGNQSETAKPTQDETNEINDFNDDRVEAREDWAHKERTAADVAHTSSPPPPIETSSDVESDAGEVNDPSSSLTATPTAKQCFLWRLFFIDPAIMLAFFAIHLSGAVFQNQLLYQTCTVVYHYSAKECEPMLGIIKGNDHSQAIEDIVQPYVVSISNARSYISAVVPAIFLLFIGPWTDRFGRRSIVLATFIGFFCNFLIASILAWVALDNSFTPWLYVITVIPSSVTGSTCVMLTVVYCYISDAFEGRIRAIRMFYNDAAMGIGLVIGNTVSSYLFAASNMATVFGVSALLMLLAFAYTYFLAKEILVPEQASLWEKIRCFFDYKLVKNVIKTCTEKRPENARIFIWLAMFTIVLTNFVTEGETNVVYLFVRRKFQWTLADFNDFRSISSGIQIIGGVLGMIVLRKLLNISVVTLAVISLGCCVTQSTVRAAAAYAWEMYLGSALGFFSGILNPMLLAILSHLGTGTEMGKIYALTNCLSTLAPLAAAPLYSSVYTATFTNYPGFYNIISVILYLISFTLIATIFGIRMARGYTVHI